MNNLQNCFVVTLENPQSKLLVEELLQTVEQAEFLLLNDKLIKISAFVDGRGLACPQPLLQAKRALKNLQVGDYLYLVATDLNSLLDIQAFANHAQIKLFSWQSAESEKLLHFLLRKS